MPVSFVLRLWSDLTVPVERGVRQVLIVPGGAPGAAGQGAGVLLSLSTRVAARAVQLSALRIAPCQRTRESPGSRVATCFDCQPRRALSAPLDISPTLMNLMAVSDPGRNIAPIQ